MGKAFIMGGKAGMKAPATSRLPSGYTELAGIQSSGTQYIDPEYAPKATTKVECDFAYTKIASQYSGLYISGSWFMFGMGSGGSMEYYLGSTYKAGSTATTDRKVIVLDASAGTVVDNGTTCLSGASYTAQTGKNLLIFALQRSSAINSYCYMTLYAYRVYEADALVHDYVPAMRDNDGEIGLYDMVGGTFYTNAGTGTFIGLEVAA